MQTSPTKISVIGAGNVGMAISQAILARGLAQELVLFDYTVGKADGEILDLELAYPFTPQPKMIPASDYSYTAASDLCIITPWAQPRPGESSLNLLQENALFLKRTVPQLVSLSPNTTLLLVLNPVEVLTHFAYKVACKACEYLFNKDFPSNRVIGTGTKLDTLLFRLSIARQFNLNYQHVEAFIIGEQGDRSVAPGSSISVGGVPFRSFLDRQEIPYEEGTLENIHNEVINSTGKVIRLKGYTSWGIGNSVADLASSILRDQREIHPVAVLARGFNGYEGVDVFMSLPAQLGRGGVLSVTTHMHLTDGETQRLNGSIETMLGMQRQLVL